MTGEERDYLLGVIAAGEPISAVLRDGRRIRGQILAFDNDTIRFDLDGNEEVFNKNVISYLEGE